MATGFYFRIAWMELGKMESTVRHPTPVSMDAREQAIFRVGSMVKAFLSRTVMMVDGLTELPARGWIAASMDIHNSGQWFVG